MVPTAAVPPTAPPAATDRTFCLAALPHVSRTFALSIRFLPRDLEYSVLIAYLLCRVADTIEDSAALAPAEKGQLLAYFRQCVEHEHTDVTPLQEAFAAGRGHDERLARGADAVLRELRRLPPAHRAAIRPWVQEMCIGMAEFASLSRPPDSGESRLIVLPDVAALERYCYYVAGTVGLLLTTLFRLRFRRSDPAHNGRLESLATSFGLGLQLTNIIKDVTADRHRGWSFVPQELCEPAGIHAEQLCDPKLRPRARLVMGALIDKARGHLDDAITYCTTVPRDQYGIRLFCLTSVYLAARTLSLATRDPHLLEAGHTVKITRHEVYRTVAATCAVAPSNTLSRRYYRSLL